jgi:hypothetical protein
MRLLERLVVLVVRQVDQRTVPALAPVGDFDGDPRPLRLHLQATAPCSLPRIIWRSGKTASLRAPHEHGGDPRLWMTSLLDPELVNHAAECERRARPFGHGYALNELGAARTPGRAHGGRPASQ